MKIEEYIEQIKEQLVLAGYAGKSINYKELQELHQKYGSQMNEKGFAQEVLELSDVNYRNLKYIGIRAIILKERVIKKSKEEIEQIKEKLVSEGYAGKLINYKELRELHQEYGNQMKEVDFAQEVLELSYSNYNSVKHNGHRARILKEREIKTSEEEIKQIKERLVSEGYTEKIIDYEELQELHQKYGSQMQEIDFAQKVLEISYSNYNNVKNKGTRTIILKEREIQTSKEEIEKIKEQLVLDGYVAKLINYEELQKLHQKNGSKMPEVNFAQEVLEISYGNYMSVKNKGTRAIILKGRVVKTSKEEIEKIKEQLVLAGYAGKLINYEELQELHQKYGSQMQEKGFAREVLEIGHGNYMSVKNKGTRAVILKERVVKISEEEIEEIKEKLVLAGYAGKPINYEELQELHKTYGNQMQEADFAQEVLEISYSNYNSVKYNRQRAKILCHDRQVELVKSILLKESRWYTKEEVEKMCEENGISIDKFIEQILGNRTQRYNGIYRKLIEQKGKIWIGRTRVSEEFLKRYEEEILNLAKKASNNVKNKFGKEFKNEYEDWKQEAIICFIENSGDIEKNFEDWQEERERRIYNTLRKYILHKVLCQCRKIIKVVSLHQRFRLKNNEKELESVIPSDYNLEEDIVQREHSNEEQFEGKELAEKCIKEMRIQIEAGLGRNEILEHIERKFKISKVELLKIMQDYLMENGRVRISTDGEVSWEDDSR